MNFYKVALSVITSYSIHYTKLYDGANGMVQQQVQQAVGVVSGATETGQ